MQSFYSLIDRLNQLPAQEREATEQLIWDAFGTDKVVFVLDMSGFSSTVQRYGILHFLCAIRRMTQLAAPILRSHGGELVKQEADNLFAVFDDADAALATAAEINREIARVNRSTPERDDIAVGIGLDRGRVLLVPGSDLFGDAMNRASKLGEDLARSGEVLFTDAVLAACQQSPRAEPVRFTISGIELPAHRLLYG